MLVEASFNRSVVQLSLLRFLCRLLVSAVIFTFYGVYFNLACGRVVCVVAIRNSNELVRRRYNSRVYSVCFSDCPYITLYFFKVAYFKPF